MAGSCPNLYKVLLAESEHRMAWGAPGDSPGAPRIGQEHVVQ